MHRRGVILATVIVATAVAACQTMQPVQSVYFPGRVYEVRTGKTLQFSIEKSHGSGRMEALDSVSGEKFSGEYYGFHTGQGAVYGHVGAADVALVTPPTGANAYGILVGDKGTTIRLYFQINTGWRPTGHATGADQNGNAYEAFF
jgi:hypothetical protein